jgi:hypothetical protein
VYLGASAIYSDMRALTLITLAAAAGHTLAKQQCFDDSKIVNTKNNQVLQDPTPCTLGTSGACSGGSDICTAVPEQGTLTVPCDAAAPGQTGDASNHNGWRWCVTPKCIRLPEENATSTKGYCVCTNWLRPDTPCFEEHPAKWEMLSQSATEGLAGFAFIYLVAWACLLFIGLIMTFRNIDVGDGWWHSEPLYLLTYIGAACFKGVALRRARNQVVPYRGRLARDAREQGRRNGETNVEMTPSSPEGGGASLKLKGVDFKRLVV